MPKIAIYKNLIFYLVSFDLSEKMHLHVFSKNKNRSGSAKIWLNPTDVFEQGNLTKEELNIAIKLIETNRLEIEKLISEFQLGKKVKPLNFK